MSTDAELLKSFVNQGSEDAFAALVSRHAAMVRGVALRCIGDETLADEVTQTVFTVLTRRASSVPSAHLAGWLHKTASFAALAARRKSRRYQQALEELSLQQDTMSTSRQNNSEDAVWEEIRPHLDEAISSLPEKTRQPVIMRFFEGRSVREIASAGGKSEEASRKELRRALERLSGILRRRGILTTGTALGVMLGTQNLFAPPVSAAAVAAAALKAGPSLAASSALLSQTAIVMTTAKTVTATAAAAVILASIPTVVLWSENAELKREVSGLKAAAPKTVPLKEKPPGQPVPPASKISGAGKKAEKSPESAKAPDGAAALAALFSKDAIAKRLEEDVVKNAEKDMKRIALYLPDLSDRKKEEIRSTLEAANKVKLDLFKKAFEEDGAFKKVMDDPEKAKPEDYALMAAVAPSQGPAPEEDPLASILAPEEFAIYRRKQEEKRVGDAEGSANETLKSLGGVVDLSPEQKDGIFQALADLQLNPPPGQEPGKSNALLDQRLREQEKERILQESLTAEQMEAYSHKKDEDKRNAEAFLKALGGQKAK